MENKKISSQYPSRSYGNRQQPEKKVKKAEGQNIFARSGRAVKKKFRIFSIRAGMDMPFFLLIMVILCIGLVMPFFRELRKRLLCLRRQLLFHQGPGAVRGAGDRYHDFGLLFRLSSSS